MAVSRNGGANAAHVNMMTDTIIGNLPADGLRVVIRSLLASHPEITSTFEHETRKYLGQSIAKSSKADHDKFDIKRLRHTQQIIRCMLGSGVPFEGITLLGKLVIRGAQLALVSRENDKGELGVFLASLDGDIVQAMTAVKKTLFVDVGARELSTEEQALIHHLLESLIHCENILQNTDIEFPYARGLITTSSILGIAPPALSVSRHSLLNRTPLPPQARETFQLGDRILPRIFSGLWQMSSPAWGAAPISKIVEQFSTHVQSGFTAFDMADHYGDAEIIYLLMPFTHKLTTS
ncbi:hypothetical protein NW762_008384 [Fusarium torreyae]|uniref:NADP-dependent oxidoreductase domain-containing protein n=1 Tax=Fusarium torreyae TaxID=1237075 RepID=A0A9W8RXJ8_9HYPO|nr:hypothetical protein NW762_008384 [Fusarium torreyae]